MANCQFRLSLIVVLASLVQQQLVAAADSDSPPTPVFATNYRVRGLISLPYAELNEPFNAYYDKNTSRSRTDYYGDLYKIYQFGPQSAPEEQGKQFGSIYKLAWVPANFKLEHERRESVFHKIESLVGVKPLGAEQTDGKSKTPTRRACFGVHGSVGNTIRAQTVLPDLTDYAFDSVTDCPQRNLEHRHKKCELWRYTTKVGDKKSTYKMWVKRDEQSGVVVPVHFYMLGYDAMLGSHFDRYDLSYYEFEVDGALDSDFAFDAASHKCGSMPGPGDNASDAAKRSHFIVNNPIHEFVVEPHRYDHMDHEFDKFTKEHKKEYASELHQRKGWLNYLHNFRFIESHNRKLQQYKLKVNRFADSNVRDLNFLRGRLYSQGYNGGLDYALHHKLKTAQGRNQTASLPESWDWNIRGAVTQVKDQAICGSCWSFATTGALEGANFVKTGKLVRLSQQQLVDCSWKWGSNGCDGSEDWRAYKYVMAADGISTEEDYGGYLGVDGRCHDRDVPKAVKISGFYNITAGDQDALRHAIVNYGPASVSIDASQPTFTFYSHGVYYDEKCNNSPDGLDHAVLAVGYTKIDGEFVWQIKNSWSTYWGDNGYILMSSKNNNCGVMDAPTIPIVTA